MSFIQVGNNFYYCDSVEDVDYSWAELSRVFIKGDTDHNGIYYTLTGGALVFKANQADVKSTIDKQDALVSATNIKTINGSTILGSGDLTVSGTDATKLAILNNLSDLNNIATARTNLGLDTTANQTDSTNKRFMSDAQETKLDAVVLPTGTPDGTKYLRDDNTWQAISGGSGLAQYQVRQLIRR